MTCLGAVRAVYREPKEARNLTVKILSSYSIKGGVGKTAWGRRLRDEAFSPRELVLRVQALLRRSRSSAQNYVLEVAEFQVDRNNFDIRLEGKPLELTPIEFKLLATLIERRGRIQSRVTLLNDVWGYQNAMDTRTVDTHIRRLREKLGRHAPWLQTVRGEGYRFNTVLDSRSI